MSSRGCAAIGRRRRSMRDEIPTRPGRRPEATPTPRTPRGRRWRRGAAGAAAALAALGGLATPAGADDAAARFAAPASTERPMYRFWSPTGTLDRGSIDAQLQA